MRAGAKAGSWALRLILKRASLAELSLIAFHLKQRRCGEILGSILKHKFALSPTFKLRYASTRGAFPFRPDGVRRVAGRPGLDSRAARFAACESRARSKA